MLKSLYNFIFTLVVSDDSSTTTTQKPTPPKFVIQVRPPTLYLAQAIRISDGNQETTLGVAGTELSSYNLTSIMYKASDAAPGSNFPNCRNSKDRLLCYLVDTSGYVLGMFSNEMITIFGIYVIQTLADYFGLT